MGKYGNKDVIEEEYDTTVMRCGNSAHIRVSKAWVGKRIRVILKEVIKEEE